MKDWLRELLKSDKVSIAPQGGPCVVSLPIAGDGYVVTLTAQQAATAKVFSRRHDRSEVRFTVEVSAEVSLSREYVLDLLRENLGGRVAQLEAKVHELENPPQAVKVEP